MNQTPPTWTRAYSPARLAARPLVLQATHSLGIGDAEVARWLDISPGNVGDWGTGRRPIPAVNHLVLTYVVADLIEAELAVDSRHPGRVRAALKAAAVLGAAMWDELPDVAEPVRVRCARLAKKLLKQIVVAARAEYEQRERLIKKGDEILGQLAAYKRGATKR